MSLLLLKDYELKIKPELLTIKPFSKIWKRDRNRKKEMALKELSYIYFMADYKSDFYNIINEEKRREEIINSIFDGNWKEDDVIKEALEFYKERQKTVSLKLLEDARTSVDKLSTFISNINYNEKDKNGKPIHDIKKVSGTFSDLSSIIETLNKLEEKVKKELEALSEARGKSEKNIFEDGF